MQLCHIVADYSSASEGIRRVIHGLAEAQIQQGHRVRIVCTGIAADPPSGVELISFPRQFPRKAYTSIPLCRALRKQLQGMDLVHIHSNWTLPVWASAWTAKQLNIPCIHSAHGCLDPVKLRHGRFRKALVSPLDKAVMRHASRLHAASDMEADWIVNWLPERKNHIQIIPHAIDIPSSFKIWSEEEAGLPIRFLSIGRLHPLKGLDLWLEALAQMSAPWECVIAGPSEQDTLPRLESLCDRLRIKDRVRFLPFVNEPAKTRLMTEADVFVLPSLTENFGLAAGEAMAFGLPVLVSTGSPWAKAINELPDHNRPGWVAEPTIPSLRAAAEQILKFPRQELERPGRSSRNLIASTFDRNQIFQAYEVLYKTVINE